MTRRPIRNALERTACRYSARAMARTLLHGAPSWSCSTSASGPAMRMKMSCSDGLRLLEVPHGRARRERAQQLLRIAARPQLLVAAEVEHLLDAGSPSEHAGPAVGAHADRVLALARADLLHRPVEHLVAA